MFSKTTATNKVLEMTKRIRAVPGGTSASKTISILLVLISKCQRDTRPTLTSIVSESVPHLKRGAIRDFLMIMKEHNYFKDDMWNISESTYTFETGSKIEFFSADQPDKLRGARRDRLFINEANNVSLDSFEQLEVRTKEFIFIDWNPTNEFWYYTDVKGKRDDVEEITLTYKDNEALSPEIIASIEQRMNRKGWWQVYGLGQLGEVEGKIYKDWKIIDEVPHEARLERRGLDFGYSNDPSAIIDVYKYNGGYILDEILYRKGQSNKQLADTILNQQYECLVIADSAEPKSIDEIKMYGVNIMPAQKGKGSISTGIAFVQAQKISVTKRSANLIAEYRNYLWMTDKNGRILNEPEGGFDHCFSGDTLVYTTKGKIKIQDLVGKEGYVFSRAGRIEKFRNVRQTRTNTEVISITFDDGNVLCVTPDHLLLQPNGEWIEARLLVPSDKIQSGMYESNIHIQRLQVRPLSFREVFQRACEWTNEMVASLCLGDRTRNNSNGFPYSSQRSQSQEQCNRQSRIETQISSSKRSYDTCQKREAEIMGRENTTTHKEVAWIKRGNTVAQVTWQESNGEQRIDRKGMFTLPQEVSHETISDEGKILWSELQNESTTKTIVGIERGFCSVTYNMEVDGTHCLIADGVIAHNCLDAVRYGLSSVLTPDEYIQGVTVTYHNI